MRKVIMFNMITLDGYFEGSKKWDLTWHQVDQEFNEFAIDQLHESGGIIFGRVTYEGMAAYWSSPASFEDDPDVASLMNSIPKYVFSKSLQSVDWKNTQLLRGDAVEELEKLKSQPGKDLLIFGSAELSFTFIRNHLLDEFRLIIAPVILGAGTPLFKANGQPLKLQLIKTRTFHNGNVLLYYSSNGK